MTKIGGCFKYCGRQLGYRCVDVVLHSVTVQTCFGVHKHARNAGNYVE